LGEPSHSGDIKWPQCKFITKDSSYWSNPF